MGLAPAGTLCNGPACLPARPVSPVLQDVNKASSVQATAKARPGHQAKAKVTVIGANKASRKIEWQNALNSL